VGTEYVGGSGGKNANSATTRPTSQRFEQRMPASAVEIKQLFAQPWSSAAGLGLCSCAGAKVASVASPSSGCAAMGASAAIVSLLLFWWRVERGRGCVPSGFAVLAAFWQL